MGRGKAYHPVPFSPMLKVPVCHSVKPKMGSGPNKAPRSYWLQKRVEVPLPPKLLSQDKSGSPKLVLFAGSPKLVLFASLESYLATQPSKMVGGKPNLTHP